MPVNVNKYISDINNKKIKLNNNKISLKRYKTDYT